MPKYCICYSCKNRNSDVCGRYPEFVDKDNKDYDPEYNINCGEECTGECATFYCYYYEKIRTQPGSFKDGTWEEVELKNDYDEVWGVRYQRNVYQIDFDFEEKMFCISAENEPVYVRMEILEAIAEKVKELGWTEGWGL